MRKLVGLLAGGVMLAGLLGGSAQAASPQVNVIVGTRGRDVLVGTVGNDAIFGKGRGDIIIGKGGKDGLFGNAGWDRLYAVDGRADLVSGGSGHDKCYVDRHDTVDSCEIVIVLKPGHDDD